MGSAKCVAVATSAPAQTLDKKVLSLEAAMKIARVAETAARARGVGVVAAVVGDGSHLMLFHRLDDTQVPGVNVGTGEAHTAAVQHMLDYGRRTARR